MNERYIFGRPIIGRRIVAIIIDQIIITVLAMSPFFFTSNFGDEDTFFIHFSVTMAIGLCGILFKDVFGRSLGKRLLGIYIAHEKDPSLPVSAGQRILRNIPLPIWPVELICAIKDKKGRRLGDRLANTRTVVNMEKKNIPVPAAIVSVFAVFFLIMFFGVSLIIRGDGSYRTATEFIQKQNEIVTAVGVIKGFGTFPSGRVGYSNGYGTARLGITVFGEKANITVSIYLEKVPDGEWEVKNYKY